jgi:hypothetical protein
MQAEFESIIRAENLTVLARVARWYIFIPIITIGVYFRGSLDLKCLEFFMVIWYILRQLSKLYSHLVYIFCDHLKYFFPFWYVVLRRIWQPCFLPLMAGRSNFSLPVSAKNRNNARSKLFFVIKSASVAVNRISSLNRFFNFFSEI